MTARQVKELEEAGASPQQILDLAYEEVTAAAR